MGYFPFFMDLSGVEGLIVGGGITALRKIEKMLPYGPRLTVVSPDFHQRLATLSGLTLICQPFSEELLEGKTAYSLRHTFATVCQQYVRPDIVDIWMGDSTTRLVGKVYTHFPDEFMLENMLKVQFTQA